MKIAFVAMSGIRACDAELLRLGLTLPGFVERSKQIASLPSLGLLTLAGLTPARHERKYFEIADLKESPDIAEELAAYDLVAISSFSAQIPEAYELCDRLRERDTPTVLGGLHVSSLPDEAATHARTIVLGEGEPVWPRLLQDAETGDLQPVYDARGLEYDLADAPMPAFELLDMSQYNRITVQTSRGCPWRCEFCASSILITRRYKQKPMEKVLAEIDRVCERWERPFIEFADDNSFVNRPYWKDLLPELARRRIRWFTETDLSVARDEELLHLMREAGCAQVLIGLESPVREGLAGLETRANWKWQHYEEYRDAIARIQHAGISVNGCFVVGLDEHGPDIFGRIVDFTRDTGLHEVQVTLPTPFPGTPLYRRLEQEGRLTHPGEWQRCTLFDLNFTPARMSAAELESGFRDLVVRLYGDELTHERRENFRRMMREGRMAVA